MKTLLASMTLLASPAMAIIGGSPLDPAKFPQIVVVSSEGTQCSGALVGPRVLLTSAHCVSGGAVARFTVAEKRYEARMERSPSFVALQHDMALGLVGEAVAGVVPLTVARRSVATGDLLRLAGHGCTTSAAASAQGGLHVGKAKVVKLTPLDMTASAEPVGGGALCWGDSGAPALADQEGRDLVGIGSRGDMNRSSTLLRLDSRESEAFLDDFIQRHRVDICGVNTQC